MTGGEAAGSPSAERLGELLADALDARSDTSLRAVLVAHSGLPGPRLNLTLAPRVLESGERAVLAHHRP